MSEYFGLKRSLSLVIILISLGFATEQETKKRKKPFFKSGFNAVALPGLNNTFKVLRVLLAVHSVWVVLTRITGYNHADLWESSPSISINRNSYIKVYLCPWDVIYWGRGRWTYFS